MNMETDKKGSKLATIFAIVAVLVIIFFGWSLYRSVTNTPERAVQEYMHDLATGTTKDIDARSSEALQNSGKAIIQRYEAMLKGYNEAPQFMGKEEIGDRFNTYPKNSTPQKITYKLTNGGNDHTITFLVYKQKSDWKIDDITGS
jgi:hypothetical protein